MDHQLLSKLHQHFEDYVHQKEGVEFWYARDLQILLGYDRWENFYKAVERAKTACELSKCRAEDHFRDVTKMVDIGSGVRRSVEDIVLTRYACYVIAQNGDPRKVEIAFAQTYFAVQTRKQEVIEQRIDEIERLHVREKLSASEKELSGLVYERGLDGQGFARLRSRGDEALFGGHSTQTMKKRLGVPEKRALADFLPSVTIKAKDLATEITNLNIRADKTLKGESPITYEHVKNNRNMRQMLAKSGLKPENLPASEDTKKLGRKLKVERKTIG